MLSELCTYRVAYHCHVNEQRILGLKLRKYMRYNLGGFLPFFILCSITVHLECREFVAVNQLTSQKPSFILDADVHGIFFLVFQ